MSEQENSAPRERSTRTDLKLEIVIHTSKLRLTGVVLEFCIPLLFLFLPIVSIFLYSAKTTELAL